MTAHTGKFKDPHDPATRLYGEVLSTRSNLHFVKVTRRNSRTVDPYNTIVPVEEFTTLSQPDSPSAEFITDSGANKGYWRQQLRGKDGRFIEMGGGIEWTDSNGKRRLGTVDGFDDEIERVIVRDSDGNEYKLSADEIKQSATKAVIPDTDSDSTPAPEGDTDELDFDALIMEIEGKPVDIEEFMGDESKFPVGGPPLEIKDKQGKPVATIAKTKGEDGNYSILFSLLLALLPHELSRFFRNFGK